MHTRRPPLLRIILSAAAALLLTLPPQSRADDFAERMKQEQARRTQRLEAEKAETEAKKKSAQEAFAALAPLELTIENLRAKTFRSLQFVNNASHSLKGDREATAITKGIFSQEHPLDAAETELILALQSPKFNLTLRPAAGSGIMVKEISFTGSFTPEGKAVLAALKPAPDSAAYEVWLKDLKNKQNRQSLLNAFKQDPRFRERALHYAAAELGKAWQSNTAPALHPAYKQQLELWAPISEPDPITPDYDWRAGSAWLYEVILLHSRSTGAAVPEYYYQLAYTPAPADAAKALERINALPLPQPKLNLQYLEQK